MYIYSPIVCQHHRVLLLRRKKSNVNKLQKEAATDKATIAQEELTAIRILKIGPIMRLMMRQVP